MVPTLRTKTESPGQNLRDATDEVRNPPGIQSRTFKTLGRTWGFQGGIPFRHRHGLSGKTPFSQKSLRILLLTSEPESRVLTQSWE